MTVSSNGTPTLAVTTATNTPSVTSTWGTGQNRTAGDLLVAVVCVYGTTTSTPNAAPTGWNQHAQSASVGCAIGYYTRVATGSDSAPVFTGTCTGTAADAQMAVLLFDLSDSSGATPSLIADGTNVGTTGTTLAPVTTGEVLSAGELAIGAMICGNGTTTATTTWATPANWTFVTDQTATSQSQCAFYTTTSATALVLGDQVTCSMVHGRTSASEAAVIILIGTPVSGNMGTLTDTFPGSTLNSVLWTDAGIAGTVTVSNQVTIALPIETGGTGYYTWIESDQAYDLTGSCALVELVSCTTGVTDFYVDFFLNYGTNQFNLNWEIDDAATTTINANYTNNYNETNLYTATYVAATYKWLMIDNFVPGTISWRYSANGINWTVAATTAVSTVSTFINIAALRVQLQSSTDTNLATASSSVWGNLNNPPVMPLNPRMSQSVKRGAFY